MLSQGPVKPGETPEAPRTTIFHEMIHQWVGMIDAPMGVSSWFSEGLTTYYQDLLQVRGGFETLSNYQSAINKLFESYYTSKARNWSADAITKVGFSDEEVRHTPYLRSALYFYDLDARIRQKSRGKRTLKDMIFPMFISREKGEKFDTSKWISMVVAELGPQEEDHFEKLVIDGSLTIEPRADLFGPCFARQVASFNHDGKVISGYRWALKRGIRETVCRAY
ncbi:MAG: hypothetical protein QM605_14400, partial [Sphingobium sp.]